MYLFTKVTVDTIDKICSYRETNYIPGMHRLNISIVAAIFRFLTR